MAEQIRSRKALYLFVFAAAGILLILYFIDYFILVHTWWVYRDVDFPDESEIQAMTASLGLPSIDPESKMEGDIADFPVPADHLPKIFRTLTPAEKDYQPLPWFYMGSMTILCKDGREIKVFLYRVDDDPNSFGGETSRHFQEGKGAFSILGPRGPVYFRGGKSKDLESAIRQAYADYKLSQLKK
jgi:hypothetical protein